MKIFHRIRKKKPFLSILFILLVVIIPGCMRKTHTDQSFSTNLPCTAPCWYDLILNTSNKTDVLTTLYQLPFIDKKSIREYGSRWGTDDQAIEIYYECSDPRKSCGSLTLSGDRLKMIWILTNYPLTLKNVVEKLDNPEYLEYGVCDQGAPKCSIILSWPDQNIMVKADVEKTELCDELRTGQTIPPETQVTDIFYATKETFTLEAGSCLHRLVWPGFNEP